MTQDYEDFHDEHPAITAAFAWAGADNSINWKSLIKLGDRIAEKATALNSWRRRQLRIAALNAAGRSVPVGTTTEEEQSIDHQTMMTSLLAEMRTLLDATLPTLPLVGHALIEYMTKHEEGASALRSWLRHLGFSNPEVSWLRADAERAEHGFLKQLQSPEEAATLLNSLQTGADPKRLGFPEVQGPEVPADLAAVIRRFHQVGVTPGLVHFFPAVAALMLLAESRGEDQAEHPSYEGALMAAVGARGTCYSSRTCTGKPLARNVTGRSCKRIGGKSLHVGTACLRV